MSRIGRMPISVPSGVKVEIDGTHVAVSGAKGKLEQRFNPEMQIELQDGVLSVKRPTDSREHRSMHGLTRSLLNNMVTGVSTGYTRRLRVDGVGYRAEMRDDTLVLYVGYSHPIEFTPLENMSFNVEDRGKLILVNGIDKQIVGEVSARIRKTRPPEPYKGKGIRYDEEIIRRKAGKTGKV